MIMNRQQNIRKRLECIMWLILVIAFSTFLFGCGDSPDHTKHAQIVNVKTSLNVRKEPNAHSYILDKLNNMEKVEVCSEAENGWIKIRKDNLTGYVKASYINILDEDVPTSYLSDSSNEESNFFTSFLEDSWSVIKVIGYIILGIIGAVILGYIFRIAFFLFALILSLFFTTLGGGIIVGLISLVVSGFDFDIASVWLRYGCGIGFILGVLSAIRSPKEFAYFWIGSTSSSGGGSGGSSGGGSGGSSDSESSGIIRRSEQVLIQRSANGDPFFVDNNGNTHWLRDTEFGFQEYGTGELFDENGHPHNNIKL